MFDSSYERHLVDERKKKKKKKKKKEKKVKEEEEKGKRTERTRVNESTANIVQIQIHSK